MIFRKASKWSALLSVLAFLFAHANAFACSCVEDNSPVRKQIENAFKSADFVAEIEVVSTSEIQESKEVSGERWNWTYRRYQPYTELQTETRLQAEFNVIRLWKGKSATSSVSTRIGMPACGLPFRAGQRVLLYAYADEDTGRLGSSSCTRTNLAKDAAEDIEILDKLVSKPTP